MQVTWQRPTATTAHTCNTSDISNTRPIRDAITHGSRSWGSLNLCRLRDSILRGRPTLPKAWAYKLSSVAAGTNSERQQQQQQQHHHRQHQHQHQHHSSKRRRQSMHARSGHGGSSSSRQGGGMALTDLPYTVFVEIVSHLSAREAVAARCLSRDLHAALTRDELSISLLLLHFPRSKEARELRQLLQHGASSPSLPLSSVAADAARVLELVDWSAAFATAARRYCYLSTATPRTTETVALLRDEDGAHLLRGVTPWNRFLRLDDKTAAFHYWDPTWTCDAASGLLVYPAPTALQQHQKRAQYFLRDLEGGAGRTWMVPFDTTGKIIRRVRLSHGILIFEWCEQQASQALDDEESAHRHFATAFDVKRTKGRNSTIANDWYTLRSYQKNMGGKSVVDVGSGEWQVTFRSEWKIHYLGLLLSHQDRFFSTHNSTHYVVYIWQPTRSPWGEDEPLERLIVWNLGEPNPYRPSHDLTASMAAGNPSVTTSSSSTTVPSESSAGGGPRIIARLTNSKLDHWGVRQNGTPSLRCLRLDEITKDPVSGAAMGHVFLVEEEHRWSAGPHSSQTPPRLHHLKATGIPLAGGALCGPRWVDECGKAGTSTMPAVAAGAGQETSPMEFCWRGERRPSQVDGAPSDSTNALMSPSSSEMETWPGHCPCWRHDDFPYLTVCEVNDVGAGVRFSARHCFMLETLSVNIKPRLRIHGVDRPARSRRSSARSSTASRSAGGRGGSGGYSGDDSSSSNSSDTSSDHTKLRRQRSGEERVRRVARRYANTFVAEPTAQERASIAGGSRSGYEQSPQQASRNNVSDGPSGQEIQFADDAWAKLLGAGHICGDERWLVGQDDNGDVTVMHF